MIDQRSKPSDDRLPRALVRSATGAAVAATALAETRTQLVALMNTRAQRPWTTVEFELYLSLSRSELARQRSYRAERRRFNEVRQRLLRDAPNDAC